MSKLDDIKPTGRNGLYKAEVRVEGEWIALALVSKSTVITVSDLLCTLSDTDVIQAQDMEPQL